MKVVLADAIKQAVDYALSLIHTQIPGVIESFDAQKQSATVKPSIKTVYLNGQVLDMPTLINVPIIFPQTENFGMTFPLEKGDGVLIEFSERSLERWLQNGHNSEPGIRRKFDINDAIAIPGLKTITDRVFYDGKNVVIRFHQAKIKLQPDNKIAIGNDAAELFDILDRLITAITSATYGGNALDNPAPFISIKADINELKGTL